jgi:hypothetical protein
MTPAAATLGNPDRDERNAAITPPLRPPAHALPADTIATALGARLDSALRVAEQRG